MVALRFFTALLFSAVRNAIDHVRMDHKLFKLMGYCQEYINPTLDTINIYYIKNFRWCERHKRKAVNFKKVKKSVFIL